MNRRELLSSNRKAVMGMSVLAYFIGQICAVGAGVFLVGALPRDCWEARHVAYMVPYVHFVTWASSFLLMYAVFRDSMRDRTPPPTAPPAKQIVEKHVWVKEGNSQKRIR